MALNIERLKQAKKEKGLSYDDLARITGYSRSTITNIFCGYIDLPRHETVQAIEAALGLNQTPITITDNDKAAGVGAHGVKLSEEEWEWIELLSEIKRKKGERAIQAIKTIILTYLEEK